MELEHNIAEWIPQRPPFVFIDTIVEMNETSAVTRFTVNDDCVLVNDGQLGLAGLMEHAAQTCAARAGWIQRQHSQQVKMGYIGAVKQMEASRLPRVGETLTAEAHVLQEVMNISLVECTTRVNDEVIASAMFKLATVD